MTYNFDPDKWYDDELNILQVKHKQGKLTQKEYNQALTDLERRLNEMWQRLDGTYQVTRD
ncbi:MAG: hypothetical protein ACQEQ5_05650 [Thermodesulfobacteriota bacterium]